MYKVNISAFDSTKIKTVNTFINNLRNIQAQLRDELNGVSLFFRGHANMGHKTKRMRWDAGRDGESRLFTKG